MKAFAAQLEWRTKKLFLTTRCSKPDPPYYLMYWSRCIRDSFSHTPATWVTSETIMYMRWRSLVAAYYAGSHPISGLTYAQLDYYYYISLPNCVTRSLLSNTLNRITKRLCLSFYTCQSRATLMDEDDANGLNECQYIDREQFCKIRLISLVTRFNRSIKIIFDFFSHQTDEYADSNWE